MTNRAIEALSIVVFLALNACGPAAPAASTAVPARPTVAATIPAPATTASPRVSSTNTASATADTPTPAPAVTSTPPTASAPSPVATLLPSGSGTVVPASVSSPGGATATPAPVPTVPSAGAHTITLADNGKTITLQTGDRFLLMLGNNLNWIVSVADPSIVSRVPNVLVIRGAQGIYTANKAGQTTLSATGDPPCRQSRPPCAAPSQLFKLEIVVQP